MDTTFLILVAVVHLLAITDIWMSRLQPGAKVLWTINLVFMPGLGFLTWLLTRHTAYQNVPTDLPSSEFETLT